MLFATDKQTLDDLNIFGQHGSDSIYTIFNRTSTRGGAAILEEMFNYPLSDEIAINRRSGIIQYFSSLSQAFPFSAADLDVAEPYLNNTDERTKLSAQDHSVTKKLSNLIAVDAETTAIYRGISTVYGLLKNLYDFIITMELGGSHFYQPDKNAILRLLAEPDFKEILNIPFKNKLSNTVMMEYDLLFRFRHREVILKLMRHIHYMDVYFAIAKVALERQFIFPKALPKDQHQVTIDGLYHPQVKNAVPNSIHISPGSNVIFLTGANMAGKSTFMKSLSVALYLAHMGFPVAASVMEFSVLDGIYTTINLPDNLGMGASHFYAEVLRVKKMAQELAQSKNLFIVFDELFRGTNVKDACEATIACTSAFARKRNSMFVISTHIIEAGDVLRERCNNINFVYLPTRMEGTHPVYTYTLEKGITEDRHGMIIINNEGILEILEAGIERMNKLK
ncbi:MAG TPA: adenylyl-sulfate kinase [Pedobacter sp.]